MLIQQQQNILKYFIFSILVWSCVPTLQAQHKKDIEAKKDTVKVHWFNGIRLDIDMAPAVINLLSAGETYSYDAGIQASFFNKLYPTFEFGYGGANKTESNGINFKTNDVFTRIGVDFNLLKKEQSIHTNNLFLGGVRLGMSHVNYSLNNVIVSDTYWNEYSVNNFGGLQATKFWFEIVAGIRVEIFKNVFMGWTVRKKSLLGQTYLGQITPWYIPGYGINNYTNWGFNYCIGYKF